MLLYWLHILLQAGFIARVLLRPHRDPASRIAWIVVILGLPVLGMVGYVLLGETNIGRSRLGRLREVLAALPDPARAPGYDAALAGDIPARHRALFAVGQSISGYAPVGGNRVALLPDSNATIAALVADIDAATDHVHLLFYIWLPDGNGTRVAEALCRAARRGVACRAMVDDLGSRLLTRSPLWARMQADGVRLARALPVGNPVLRAAIGRIDLRNHRKIMVIDNRIAYCGSQNCADPEFRIKAKYAPWVDAVMRAEGPVARQCQHLFASDWMTYAGEDIGALLLQPVPEGPPGIPAQVVASGPTVRHSATPEMFQSLMYAARRELVITTPYYVPDEAMQAAICAAAWRGVATTLVLPARNDSWAVAAASRSYYADLLAAGVRILEFQGGLLHAKSITVDGELTLIGSANMDRRSFDLNYENNLLLCDAEATAAMRVRQDAFIAQSRPVTAPEVAAWPLPRRLWNNAVAVLGPVL
ncbi:cardiolipin synthase [Falsiroseomonas oryzae]|uniref:cardiolipin synthase n=1 Tax=Falsiroseomonas oryzae TaxID=2766473 RepID=UPI0022EB6116|nr:cardiolipin synthase [Roseomonas sp. MO-31]